MYDVCTLYTISRVHMGDSDCVTTLISEPRLHLSGLNWWGCLTQELLLLMVWWQRMKLVPGLSW